MLDVEWMSISRANLIGTNTDIQNRQRGLLLLGGSPTFIKGNVSFSHNWPLVIQSVETPTFESSIVK